MLSNTGWVSTSRWNLALNNSWDSWREDASADFMCSSQHHDHLRASRRVGLWGLSAGDSCSPALLYASGSALARSLRCAGRAAARQGVRQPWMHFSSDRYRGANGELLHETSRTSVNGGLVGLGRGVWTYLP